MNTTQRYRHGAHAMKLLNLAISIALVFTINLARANAETIVHGDGDSIDLGVEIEPTAIKFYIADRNTNEPRPGLEPTVQNDDDEEFPLKETSTPGVYELHLDEKTQGFLQGGSLVAYVGEEPELIDFEFESSSSQHAEVEGDKSGDDDPGQASSSNDHETSEADDQAHDHNHTHDHDQEAIISELSWAKNLMGLMIFASGLLIGTLIRRPRTASPALALLIVSSGFYYDTAQAHEGHDHGHIEVGEDTGGAVKISKKAQFIIGLRTQKASKAKHAVSLKTYGHIVPSPKNVSIVRSPQNGILENIRVPSLGHSVRKGDILASISTVGTVNIRAPISGTVMEMNFVSGSRVSSGDQIFRIVNTKKVWIDAEVYQKDLANVADFQDATIQVSGWDETLHAKLVGAVPIVDESSLTGKVYLEVENDTQKLAFGSLVNVSIHTSSEGQVEGFLIPKGALVQRGGEALVFVKSSANVFTPKPVATQPGPQPDEIIITAGLEDGDLIVTQGNYQLLAGAK